ncbi:hypothetical protein ID1017_03540 [Helicobacter pylori]
MKTSAKVLLTLLIIMSLGKGLVSLIKDDTIPIETRLHENKLTIISKTDNIEIQDIEFNRGNCSDTAYNKGSERIEKESEEELAREDFYYELESDRNFIAKSEKTI